MEELKPSEAPQKWINTPFAFTKFSKNLSLLQQNILIKVSERLQPFVEEFFGSDLCKSRKIPKPLFSEAVKNSGIMQFDIPYSELGVAPNKFYAAREAARKVLELKITAPGFDAKGQPVMREFNVFSYSELSAKADRVVFTLNKHVVDSVFDMRERYVSHPDTIAMLGKVDRMPMIYYLLRSSCKNRWKSEVKLTVSEIKEYLGMIEYEDGDKVKELYTKFSQFRKYVLDGSISDINRLKEEGVLDICVNYEPIYIGKRTSGNPFYIKFNIFDSIEKLKAYEAAQKTGGEGALSQSQSEDLSKQQEVEVPGLASWQNFNRVYTGKLSIFLEGCTFYKYENKRLYLKCTRALGETFISAYNQAGTEDKSSFMSTLQECFNAGVAIQFVYVV